MLRLRTTIALSALGLLIGVAGTGWLSALTDGWRGPAQSTVDTRRVPPRAHRPVARSSRWHGPVTVVTAARRSSAAAIGESGIEVTRAPIALLPLSMPADTSMSWDALRGHLDGRVRVRLTIDGEGRVLTAHLADSSGDPVLDGHALRSVRGWRFAVPAGHRGGISGELSMVFASADTRIAGVR